MTNDSSSTDNPQLIPIMPNGKDPVRYYKRGVNVNYYDFYLFDEIGDAERYADMFQIMKSSEAHDTVFIYINSTGGNLYTAVQILSAINTCPAKVVTSLEGRACSAATFIFLAGDVKMVNPNCTFMIHNYSQTTSGKGNEIRNQINYMSTFFDELSKDMYKNFLTDEEIKQVINGDDIWLTSSDVLSRLHEYDHEFYYSGDPEVLNEIISNHPEVPPLSTAKKVASKKKTSKKKVSKKK